MVYGSHVQQKQNFHISSHIYLRFRNHRNLSAKVSKTADFANEVDLYGSLFSCAACVLR